MPAIRVRFRALALFAAFAAVVPLGVSGAPSPRFVLTTPDRTLTTVMSERYTANAFGCSGGNTSPPLAWRGAPAGTKSFVLTLFDRDEHSTPSGWWHWIVYDLPPDTLSLPLGAGALHGSLPAGGLQGRSDLGENAYHGPCPAKGDAPHRYVFTVYALNVAKLDVPPDSSGAMVISTAQEHLLGKAILIAHHGRP